MVKILLRSAVCVSKRREGESSCTAGHQLENGRVSTERVLLCISRSNRQKVSVALGRRRGRGFF